MMTPGDPGTAGRTNVRRRTSASGTTTSAQVLLLQALVTIVLCYQLLFSRDTLLSLEEQELVILGLVLLFGGLMVLPARVREAGWFIGVLVLGDTAVTSAVIYLSGNAKSELYLTYFVIVLIAAFTPTVKQFIALAVVLCAAYGGILYLGIGALGSLAEGHLLQIPVLLIMALFYGSSVEMLRREREEKAHLLETIASLSQSEETLREREQRFGLTIDHANDAIFYLDMKGVIRWANGRAEVITGRPMKALVERPLLSVLSPQNVLQRDPQAVAGPEEPGLASLVELKILCPDGRSVWLELSSAEVKEQGKPVGRLVVARDRTERKQMEEHLRQAEKLAALGTLLDGVAHELNNPLFMISGSAQLAGEKIKRGQYEGLTEELDGICEAAGRAAGIVQRSMAVARSARGKRERCQVNDLIRKTLEVMANDFLIHQITTQADLQPDLPPVLADPQELTQMFLTLISNASHAMAAAHGRGTLSISTSCRSHQPQPWVGIRLADDGPGIPQEQVSRIFEPFFTTDPVAQRRGLGLAICHRVVTELGGTVTCESTVGKGITFLVRLPASPLS